MRKTNYEKFRERLDILGFNKYADFLNSDLWKSQKEKFYVLQEYPYHCFICGEYNSTFNVHHKTYKRLGVEDLKKDLFLLCRDCHQKVHYIEHNTKIPLIHIVRMVKKGKFNKKRYDKYLRPKT